MAVRLRSAYVASYSRLVRMAFLIGAAQRDRQKRAGRAHRLARRVLPWRAGPELDAEEAARSLLARLIRSAVRRGDRTPWGWRATPAPPTDGHAAIDTALATAPPAARAGYGLLVAEELTRSAAADVLRAAGITETGGALHEAAKVRDRLAERDGLPVAEQHDLVTQTPMDPTVVRLRAPDPLALRLRRLALVIGIIVLVALLTGTVTVLVARSATTPTAGTAAPRPTVAPPTVHAQSGTAWQGSFHPGVQQWPARGPRTTDTALLQRAAQSWADTANRAPASAVRAGSSKQSGSQNAGGRQRDTADETGTGSQSATGSRGGNGGGDPAGRAAGSVAAPGPDASVLYAGDLDGQTVVLMSDGTSVARYTEKGGSGSTVVDHAPRADVYAASALRLESGSGGTRYLLAPWVTHAQYGTVSASWHDLAVSGGVTGPVRTAAAPRGCWQGPALRLTAVGADLDEPIVVGDTGGAAMPHLMYIPPVPPPHITRPHEMTYKDGPQVFQRLRCLNGTGAGADSITDWRFWEGQLPEGVDASWACVRVDQADGSGTSTSAIMPDGADPVTEGSSTSGHACTRLAKDLVTTGWWKAPSGKWYFLAAGSRHVVSIEVAGGASGTRLVAIGPYPAKEDLHPKVTATSDEGAAVTVLAA